MTTTKKLKIIVPILMILAVATIWFIQNNSNEDIPTDEGLFGLHVTGVDVDALLEHELPIMIDFGAGYCPPCKVMAPDLASINEEMQNKAFVKYVDVEKYPNAATGYPVKMMPTQVFINADGTPYMPSDQIKKSIKFEIYENKNTKEHSFTIHEGMLTKEEMQMILEDMGV